MIKPSDFHIPFSRKDPKVIIHDRTWFIPPTADRSLFAFPGWRSKLLFGDSSNPIAVEYCSGNGAWILEKAKKFPNINWVAVEKRFDRARKIWVKLKRMNLKNVIVVFGEAMAFSASYMPTGSIQELYINFPDPWPKQRHIKHRIISSMFFSEAARVLTPGGKLIFVTDDAPYSEWFLDIFSSHGAPHFTSALPAPFVSAPPPDYGTSFFDTLFRQQGKTIHYHELNRTSHPAPDSICSILPSQGLITSDVYKLPASTSRSHETYDEELEERINE